MFKRMGAIALSTSLLTAAFANTTADDFQAAKQFAKSLKGSNLDAMKQFKPETTFEHYNAHPLQEGLYQGVETEKADFSKEAHSALKNDEGGKAVIEHFGKNQFEINQDNASIKQAKLIEDESYAITHGLSNARIQCDEKPPVCEIQTHDEICHTSRQLPDQQCMSKRQVTVTSQHIQQRIDVEVVVHKKWSGTIIVNLFTGAMTNAKGGHVTNLPALKSACETMSARVHSILNNGDKADWIYVTGIPSCQNNGTLTLFVDKEWRRSYPVQIALTMDVRTKPYISDEHWEDHCLHLERRSNLCRKVDERCTDENTTHKVEGLPVTRDCWEKTATYSCASVLTDECHAQKEKGCLQAASFCARMEDGACALYEQTYRCSDKVCPPVVACVKNLFCADGECAETNATQNANFGEAVTQMSVVGEAGREFSQTQTTLFSGHAVTCKIWPLNFIDCCSDEGWGEKLNLAHCRDEDKALGKAKLNYLAHYVGEYCSEKDPIFGECLERKRTYCVFDTKMARVIQEEGRLKQLNPNALGNAEHPNCDGMSVQELQRLDMTHMEFLKPVYPFNKGTPTEAAGIVNPPKNVGNISDEAMKRVQKKVGG